MKRYFISALTLLAISGLLSSCNKESGIAPPPVYGQIYFHLHTNIDTAETDTLKICTDASGRRIRLRVAQFYASNFKLQKTDGSWLTINHAYLLKTIANEMCYIGSVPSGNYNTIAFDTGLDPDMNSASPLSYSSGSIFATQNPAMWFGSIARGYMFLNVQALVDTSASHTGPVNQPVSYQTGTASMLRTVNFPYKPFSVVTNMTTFVHITCDFGKLLQGIDFKTQSTATPFNNAVVANQIANNIPGMFRYE
ncbi:MAG: MbnP family protein [Bacteroidia bacterium]